MIVYKGFDISLQKVNMKHLKYFYVLFLEVDVMKCEHIVL